jgi:hypothetical protein
MSTPGPIPRIVCAQLSFPSGLGHTVANAPAGAVIEDALALCDTLVQGLEEDGNPSSPIRSTSETSSESPIKICARSPFAGSSPTQCVLSRKGVRPRSAPRRAIQRMEHPPNQRSPIELRDEPEVHAHPDVSSPPGMELHIEGVVMASPGLLNRA